MQMQEVIEKLKDILASEGKCNLKTDNKNFENMYMTSFLQALIEKYNNAKAVEIDGNWCEIDFMSDLKINFI
ncbi:hypothetical protein RC38_03180 [Campylobacter jejuni]|nr:hypothetical protein RC21_02050 [Campylobacter jejuni]ALV98214.1 hypothetical protein RC38_03180 [Campylobacter jejuni]ALW04502.1 hypothetical protein RC13_02795 [Campylobacter jejuni]ALW23612.1 hypothetical protein RC33_02730 [Campylobacter jejuni]ALW34767.1 hypothetical protein RC39_03155 [Campylobacter jejuni]